MLRTISTLAALVATATATNHIVEAPAPEYPAGWPAPAAPAPAVHEVAPPQHVAAPPQHVAAPQYQADPWAWDGGNLAQPHAQPIGVSVISYNNGGGAEWQQVAAPQHQASPVQGSAPAAVTHEVIVGGDDLIYSPASIQANMGDIVQFNFMRTNHTVTQSTFATPCKLMPDGMDSGFMANPNDTMVPAPAFRMEVTTTEPLWFYCKQRMGTHCGQGMVFSINPTAERTMDQFLQAAVQQNGTGEVPPAAAAAAAASVVVAPPASAATPEGGHIAPAPAAAPAPHEVAGHGEGAPGACSCSCLCGVADYPSGMGIGMWGGLSGAIPMPVSGPASGGAPAPVSY